MHSFVVLVELHATQLSAELIHRIDLSYGSTRGYHVWMQHLAIFQGVQVLNLHCPDSILGHRDQSLDIQKY